MALDGMTSRPVAATLTERRLWTTDAVANIELSDAGARPWLVEVSALGYMEV